MRDFTKNIVIQMPENQRLEFNKLMHQSLFRRVQIQNTATKTPDDSLQDELDEVTVRNS